MRWVLAAIVSAALTVGVAAWLGRPQPAKVEAPPLGELAAAADLDMARVREAVRVLSEPASRVTGYEGASLAREYVLRELAAAGIDDVEEQPSFGVAVPIVHEARLTAQTPAGPVTVPIHPLWPNLARTCQTPPEGISGPLVDVGRGSDAELAGNELRGAIVIMDWHSRVEWLSVPEFGGKSVLFRANPQADGNSARSKFLTVPGDVPRFYVATPDLPALDALIAAGADRPTIHCRMTWERGQSRNILARVSDGTKAGDAGMGPVVFHAYTDSISVVPTLAPGAQQACGAAVLLELARYFRNRETIRPVYVLFTGGHGQALHGMTRFVRRLKDGLAETWESEPDSLMARMGEPGLFVGLDVSSHSKRFGVFCCGHFRGQWEGRLRPKFSTLGLELDKFAKACTPDLDAEKDLPAFVDCINLTLGRGWWTYFPYHAPFESELPTLAAIPGITLGTVNDSRRHVDTPDDSFERVDFAALASQLLCVPGRRVGLANITFALASWEGRFVNSALADKLARLGGEVNWLDQERNFTPDEPLVDATVFLKTQRGDKFLCGTRGMPVTMTDNDGEFEFDGLIQSSANGQFENCLVEAYGTADEPFMSANGPALREYQTLRRKMGRDAQDIPMDGAVIYAIDMAREKEYPWRMRVRKVEQNLNMVCFPCRSVTLYGLTDPREYIDLKDVQILNASTLSPPYQFGRSATDQAWGNPDENCVTVWADPDLRVRLTLGFGFQKKRLVLINNTAEDPLGTGFALKDLETVPSMILRGAEDMANLDEKERLLKLERHGINNPRVRRLHDEAKEYLRIAKAARAALNYQVYRTSSERAWSLESKAYGELLSMTNNMIRGVLFYLAMLLPFAYCMERLVLASGTIKKRMAGVFGIFIATFAVLALVHPAFRFTLTPLVVLQAFVVLALSGTVCWLMLGRFDAMLQRQKQALTGLREDARNVGGIAVRAIDLGIANIRRRKQRGFLTGMTIVAVMFTLLSFVSIVPELNISKLRHPDGVPSPKRLLARDRAWGAMRTPAYDSIRRTFRTPGKARGVVAGRGWFFSDWGGELSQIDLMPTPGNGEGGKDDSGNVAASGFFTTVSLLCMEPSEPAITGVDSALSAGRWFEHEDDLGIILPKHVATCLGYVHEDGEVDLGRDVLVFGRRLPLIGLLDSKAFDAIEDIDGEPLTPVNFVLQRQMMAERSTAEEEADTLEEYQHYASDQLAIVPFKFGRSLGAALRSVAVKVREDLDPVTEAETFARRSNQTILASDENAVILFASVAGSKLSAAGQIAVPILLGFLMVLGTMLGSVYERRKEIFVYNSVGLSPTHVSALFLAESSVYAVVGACLGYLLGQVVSKVLHATGLLSGLTLNYSAGATVLVTILTMLIVLLSTIYPARQAFLAAIPEAREEEGAAAEQFAADRLSLFLPFVTTPAHVFAMQAYMHQFLDSIQGVTVGRLAIDNLEATMETVAGRPAPTLVFRAWLAPFDLGVSHDARLQIVFREHRGVYQYHLSAVRFSGDHQSWRRLTPRFVLAMRKQLLMWRILPGDVQARYVQEGATLFGVQALEGAAEAGQASVLDVDETGAATA